MKTIKNDIVTVILMLFAICGFTVNSVVAGDQEDIQGTWTLESVTVDGRAMPNVSGVYIFSGETLIIRLKAGSERKATFKLEASGTPKILVVHRDESARGQSDRTPYALDGDTLKIAFPTPDERSPDVSDKGRVLFTLKRKTT